MHMKPMKYLAFLYIVIILTVILLCMAVISSLQFYIQSVSMDCLMSCIQHVIVSRSWSSGLGVESAYYVCRESGFSSQSPYDASQQFLTALLVFNNLKCQIAHLLEFSWLFPFSNYKIDFMKARPHPSISHPH